MPMAKMNPNTVARLAMGTAILTVISGCDNRIGQGISDTAAPMTTMVKNAPVVVVETLTPVTQAVVRTPGVVLETLVPSTTAVVEPEYIVPGAPTYVEGSQAANVQTFEAIYGRPVSTDPSEAIASAQTYAIPSYDDGTVIAQPLAAPVASYTQRVMAATAPTYETMPDSATGFVYGDTLTSEAYTVVTEPVIATPVPMFGEMAPVATFGVAEPVAYDPFVPAPVDAMPMMVEPVVSMPMATETYVIDDASIYAPDDGMIGSAPETIPRTMDAGSGLSYDGTIPLTGTGDTLFPLSYDDAIPMTDASAPVADTSAGFYVASGPSTFEPSIADVQATFGIVASPAMQEATSSFGGVEIIGNDEAEATYGTMVPTLGDRTDAMPSPVPFETLSYGAPIAPMEIATLAETPLPSPKRARPAAPAPAVASVAYGPLTAPLPRRRPAATVDSGYATLEAPLPQPRPDYENPMAAATTSGAYVSIGALPAIGQQDMAPERDAAPVAIRAASVQKTEPAETAGSEPSELSGTSWRLAEVGGETVSVNTELHFDGSSGFAGGQGPCNSYGGQFLNTGKGRFSMANIFSTDTSCPTIGIEQRYLDALKNAGSYEIVPGFSEMTLLDGDGKAIVRFKAF